MPTKIEDEEITRADGQAFARRFGALLRQRRGALGMNQSDLALATGVGRRFIIDLEAGKPSCHIGKALLVAEALGIRVVELLESNSSPGNYHLGVEPASIKIAGQKITLTGPTREDDDLPDDIEEPSS